MRTYISPLIALSVPTGCNTTANTSHSNLETQLDGSEQNEHDMTEQGYNPNEAIAEYTEDENTTDNICAFEVPAHFISTEELEIGLGPEGIILGYWSVDFYEDGIYEWNYSDITELGEFTCNENIISYSSYEGIHQSVYDIQSGILYWADVTYQ